MDRETPDPIEFDGGPLRRNAQEDWAFSAARELRDEVRRIINEIEATDEWTMTPGAIGNLAQGTFARGTKTFGAALLLCDRGYGEQAAMLNRSLFEHAVVAWWMHTHDDPDALMQQVRRHHDHATVLYARRARLHPELELDPSIDSEHFTTAYEAELDEQFGEHGGTWHGKRMDQLVREVEQRWDETYPDLLWKLFRFVNSWNNEILHHSAVGLNDAIVWTDPADAPILRLGPDRRWTQAALWAAHWSYGLLVLCAFRQLSPDRARDFNAVLDDLGFRYRTITQEQAKGVGRNDQCPCGSEKKFKHCHADRLVDPELD
jgi:SEC-C motif/Family of unknown function (DUF5677)